MSRRTAHPRRPYSSHQRLRQVGVHRRHAAQGARLRVRQQPQLDLAVVDDFAERAQVGTPARQAQALGSEWVT
jgi:hypothetical protein